MIDSSTAIVWFRRVLGDQLDHASRAFDEFDVWLDCVWMAAARR